MNTGEPAKHENNQPPALDQTQDSEDEARRIRRLQIMMSMVSSVISQDPSLTVEEASELAAGAKRAALAMFPDKELAYDLLYKPRFQRLMTERFRCSSNGTHVEAGDSPACFECFFRSDQE